MNRHEEKMLRHANNVEFGTETLKQTYNGDIKKFMLSIKEACKSSNTYPFCVLFWGLEGYDEVGLQTFIDAEWQRVADTDFITLQFRKFNLGA